MREEKASLTGPEREHQQLFLRFLTNIVDQLWSSFNFKNNRSWRRGLMRQQRRIQILRQAKFLISRPRGAGTGTP